MKSSKYRHYRKSSITRRVNVFGIRIFSVESGFGEKIFCGPWNWNFWSNSVKKTLNKNTFCHSVDNAKADFFALMFPFLVYFAILPFIICHQTLIVIHIWVIRETSFPRDNSGPVANAIKPLQACIYKSVNTGIFLIALCATIIVEFMLLMRDSWSIRYLGGRSSRVV